MKSFEKQKPKEKSGDTAGTECFPPSDILGFYEQGYSMNVDLTIIIFYPNYNPTRVPSPPLEKKLGEAYIITCLVPGWLAGWLAGRLAAAAMKVYRTGVNISSLILKK